MELNVVTGNPSRESMYPNGRFSGLSEHHPTLVARLSHLNNYLSQEIISMNILK